MTTAGWIFMLTSWTVILGLFAYCLTRTLTSGEKPREDQHASKSESPQP